jgi:hypothetical protein
MAFPLLKEDELLDLDTVANRYVDTYYDDPNRWVSENLRVFLWSIQREILDSIFRNNYTVVRSCHGSGKTFLAAVAILAFLYIRTPAKIITTAPTYKQVVNLLWSEIRTIFKEKLQPEGWPGRILNDKLVINDDWYGLGFSTKDDVNLQGYHQDNILVVVDEAPGVATKIIEALESLMSSGNCHMLMIGNPIAPTGPFYEAFSDKDYGGKFHIPATSTPNFTGEAVPEYLKRKLVNKRWVARVARKWGVDSPLYISKVKGDFPDAGDDQVISLSLCEEAKNREIEPEENAERVLGVDVARFGDDNTAFVDRHGSKILDLHTMSKRDNMAVAGWISRKYRIHGFDKANIDVIGLGSGPVDRCTELDIPVNGINVAENPIGDDKDEYANLRTQLWFWAQKWLESGSLPADHPLIDDLVADLVSPKYDIRSDGKVILQSKKLIKKDRGKSPDLGDAFVLSTMGQRGTDHEVYAEAESYDTEELLESYSEDYDTDELLELAGVA